MKIQCDVCDKNKAAVMCCADEVVLCTDCDTRVHAANKLANEHQRIHLMSASDVPARSCDICQEKTGFFFCLQDRALLCRECDVSIHTANSLASNHKRFLVPGIRVALEAMVGQQAEPAAELVVPAEEVAAAAEAVAQYTPSSRRSSTTTCDTRSPGTTANDFATTCRSSPTPINNVHLQTGNSEVWKKSSITEFLIEAVPGWRVDELLSLAEMGDGYNTSAAHDIGSPCKADASNYTGSFNWTVDLRSFDEQVDVSSHRKVPQIPTPPTMSGLFSSTRSSILGSVKAINKQEAAAQHALPDFGNAFVVPDVDLCSSSTSRKLPKRNRTQYGM
ncbi:unnamed protein product [Sphagnum jensenii]|uniref:B box-type domain-containing protein n=1 Tax=Sphagnum jensenii TaxID=128206 RepID=A0ABP0W234_9BRYO